MKKMVNIISIFLVLFLLTFSINVYAASLDTIDIDTDKQTVHPGETVTLIVDFGTEMGSYGVNVDYDDNLLEYVSVEGATANNTGTVVKTVYHYDASSGEAPRTTMSVTFKAKEGIITSNPTDLSVTLEGMGNPDASVSYDDITTPIVKNIVVEPIYVDYDIALNYTGDIIKNEEKDMKLVVSSSMGKNYEHARIIAEATSPAGETVKLLATDDQGLEHDIIQSGWGDPSGDPLGGKDVIKELDVRGLFSGAGTYAITLKIIDRDDSDAEIASETFDIEVKEEAVITPPVEENPGEEVTPPAEVPNEPVTPPAQAEETKPEALPKTGSTIYFIVLPIIAILSVAYVVLNKKD